jgi:nitrate/nitrite transporter NarK
VLLRCVLLACCGRGGGGPPCAGGRGRGRMASAALAARSPRKRGHGAPRAPRWTRFSARAFVLVCASLIPFGAHYLKHSLGPLKAYLVPSGAGNATSSSAVAVPGPGPEPPHVAGAGASAIVAAPASVPAPAPAPAPTRVSAPPLTSTQFGAFLSAVFWPNLVLPFLMGMLVDEKGHEVSALLFTSLALLGHVVFCTFMTPPLAVGFAPALLGRAVYGMGEAGTVVVQGAIIGTWFENDLVTLSIGLTESVHYLANWAGKVVPAAVAEQEGPVRALWFGNVFLFLSVLVAVVYLLYASSFKPFQFALVRSTSEEEPEASSLRRERRRSESVVSWYGAVVLPDDAAAVAEPGPGDLDDPDEEQCAPQLQGLPSQQVVSALAAPASPAPSRSLHPINYFVQVQAQRIRTLPPSFWLIGLLHFAYSNVSNLFGGISADFIHEAAQLSRVEAALIASIDSFLPIFIAPLIGALVDARGGRIAVCAVASAACVLAFALFLGEGLTADKAELAMLLLSVSTSATPTLVKSAVPLVVERDSLGTAFGIYATFEALGGATGHVLFGVLRDYSASYRTDVWLLLGLAAASGIVALLVLVYVPHLNHATRTRPGWALY